MKPGYSMSVATDEGVMLDGRVYSTEDNWTTVYVTSPGGKRRRITGRAADLARFLAITQYSGGPS
jgi:hypothetical protein